MNRIVQPLSDPVDPAIRSLASARWMHDPDWPSFKEKFVKTPSLARRHPVLFAAAITGLLCAGAAATVQVYEALHFTSEVQLDSGATAAVEGDAVLENGETSVSVNAEAPQGGAGTGQTEVVLPDGRVVRVIVNHSGNAAASPAQKPSNTPK